MNSYVTIAISIFVATTGTEVRNDISRSFFLYNIKKCVISRRKDFLIVLLKKIEEAGLIVKEENTISADIHVYSQISTREILKCIFKDFG